MSVVLSEHLPLLATAPDGIQKLRGLILELAVRGKLVPQDPKDEPARELLKRIANERARLEAEGTCKKSKATPLDAGESPVSVVAPGWESSPLGEVVEIVRGITFPSSEKSKTPEAGRVMCLRTANVQDKIEWDDILYIRSEFVSRDDQTLRPNDIVMSMANSRELVGKVALVESQLAEPATFGGFLGVLRPHMILPRFVMAFLRAPTVRSSLIDSASQTTNIANISLAKLRPLSFPIPPLAEQHRIVAKVDELMALCDRLEAEQADAEATHARLVDTLLGTLTQSTDAADLAANWQRLAEHFDTLFTTESGLDALKQTILQLAVMGKLVPQDPNDEPASELVKRISLEKDRLLSKGNLKKDKALWDGLPKQPPHFLPSNWKWCHLQDVFEISRGGSPRPAGDPQFFGGSIPWITVGEVTKDENKYLFETSSGLTEEGAKRSRFIDPDDLLLTNSGATLGVPKISRIRACMNDGVAVLRQFHSADINDFAYLYLRSQTGDFRRVNQGMGQPNLNTPIIAGWYFPLPPLAEQHRIVAKVDELMALCDRLKADLAESRSRQARLSATLIESALAAA